MPAEWRQMHNNDLRFSCPLFNITKTMKTKSWPGYVGYMQNFLLGSFNRRPLEKERDRVIFHNKVSRTLGKRILSDTSSNCLRIGRNMFYF